MCYSTGTFDAEFRRAPSRRLLACASVSSGGDVADMQDQVRLDDLFEVARKAATSIVGRSDMKPTVSDRMIRRALGSFTSRIVGSSVAKT